MRDRRSAGLTRRAVVVWSIVLGSAAIVSGVGWALVAEAEAEQSSARPDDLVTLPVGTYAQYTQNGSAPHYDAVWLGLAVGAIGAIILVAGMIAAFLTRRNRGAERA